MFFFTLAGRVVWNFGTRCPEYLTPTFLSDLSFTEKMMENFTSLSKAPASISLTQSTRAGDCRLQILDPLISTWAHLNSDVCLEEGEYSQNCLCAIVLCSISAMNNCKSSSSRLIYWFWVRSHWAQLSLLQAPLYLWTLWCYVFLKIILASLFLVEGLAWWEWSFTWWTDQLFSFSALTLLVGSSDP